MSYFNSVSYSDTGSLDAFSRLRTSSPESLFATQTQYSTAPLQMEIGATGTGVTPAHSVNTRLVALSATAGSGTSFIQSYQYSPYEPGRSQFIAITGVMGAGVAGATTDVGYFDANNGVIYRQNGVTNRQLILRTSTGGSVSDANIVAQSSWNIDKLDGTGISGKTLVDTTSFILIIDLQFLGMGRVRIGFDIDGVIYYAHQFLNAGILAVPYMQSATLPIQMLVTATSTATTKTAQFKCATVMSEGGILLHTGFNFATPETTATAGNGTRQILQSIRPKTTYNTMPNRSLFILEGVNLFVTGNQDVQWELVIGGAYSGQAWSDVNTTYSAYEYTSTPGTFTNLTGGVVIASGYNSRLGGTNNGMPITLPPIQSLKYPISLDRAGAVRTLGTLSLLVTGLAGTAASRGFFNFREIR